MYQFSCLRAINKNFRVQMLWMPSLSLQKLQLSFAFCSTFYYQKISKMIYSCATSHKQHAAVSRLLSFLCCFAKIKNKKSLQNPSKILSFSVNHIPLSLPDSWRTEANSTWELEEGIQTYNEHTQIENIWRCLWGNQINTGQIYSAKLLNCFPAFPYFSCLSAC